METIKITEVRITASGPVGSGKSALLGEIENLLIVLGIPVRYEDASAAQSEKNGTHADWLTELQATKPIVVLVEENSNLRAALEKNEAQMLRMAQCAGEFAKDASLEKQYGGAPTYTFNPDDADGCYHMMDERGDHVGDIFNVMTVRKLESALAHRAASSEPARPPAPVAGQDPVGYVSASALAALTEYTNNKMLNSIRLYNEVEEGRVEVPVFLTAPVPPAAAQVELSDAFIDDAIFGYAPSCKIGEGRELVQVILAAAKKGTV